MLLDYAKYEEKEAAKGVRENRFYTLLNEKFSDICTDDNGTCINSRSTKEKFHVQINRENMIIVSNIVHEGDGCLYYNQRAGASTFKHVKAAEENVYILEQYYRKSKTICGLKRMVVRIKKLSSQVYESRCCVIYSLQNNNQEAEVVILSSGNSKLNTRPYIWTSSETLEIEKELLTINPGRCCIQLPEFLGAA